MTSYLPNERGRRMMGLLDPRSFAIAQAANATGRDISSEELYEEAGPERGADSSGFWPVASLDDRVASGTENKPSVKTPSQDFAGFIPGRGPSGLSAERGRAAESAIEKARKRCGNHYRRGRQLLRRSESKCQK